MKKGEYDFNNRWRREITKKLEINQAICETRDLENIVSYLDDKYLSIEFIQEYQNGNIYGVYYDEDEDLVYETKDGEVYMLCDECVKFSEDRQVLFDVSNSECIKNPENHAYLINDNGILEKLILNGDTANNDSGVFYYQGEKGALVTWADNDGAEDISRSGFYLTDSFDEFKEEFLTE